MLEQRLHHIPAINVILSVGAITLMVTDRGYLGWLELTDNRPKLHICNMQPEHVVE